MRASLDTNVIIHFYRAGLQNILFEFFDEGVFIYEQIRNTELENHGGDLLQAIDVDLASGKIETYTKEKLKNLAVFRLFEEKVRENRILYGTGDLGEVYAISLAQTLGAYSLITDDTKQGGPYMSLLQFEDDIMPFTFADVLLLRYLAGRASAEQTVADFNAINQASDLHWTFRSQIAKFIRRFWKEPYREEDRKWIEQFVKVHQIKVRSKMEALEKIQKKKFCQ